MLAKSISGAAAAAVPAYIEDVFSTFLYTGNGSTQTITNGIDLSGNGGLVWVKERNNVFGHVLVDTARGINQVLRTNATDAQTTYGSTVSGFNSNGFSLGSSSQVNESFPGYELYASWTFRKQAKFFDVVTYTGNGSNRTISHNLGSVPGCIIVKRTDTTGAWQVYHRSLANTEYLVLNSTAAKATGTTRWNSTTPTSTVFSLGTDDTVNANGGTYVAYLFAHDAGGFGLAGTDNVISCGSFTTDSSGAASINLGYEPQFVIYKRADAAGNWEMLDTMRGFCMTPSTGTSSRFLRANLSSAETGDNTIEPAATGFVALTGALPINATYIYIAIRRGPMKVPTSGTSVYNALTNTGTGVSVRSYTGVGFPPDTVIPAMRESPGNRFWGDRLRGSGALQTNQTSAEGAGYVQSYNQDGWTTASDAFGNNATKTFVDYVFRRAPGFFDVVCYTGTGVARTVNHNLAAVPEMMIVKSRSGAYNWAVYCAYLGGANPANRYVLLNSPNALGGTIVFWNDTAPTSSVFTVGTTVATNNSSDTYVAYLFATCPGVSKVGSYTGTGTTQTINCGFTGGARFVLIKRTDSTGDWYVWDTARGIVAGDDPYLLLNSTAAEVTNTDYIDPVSSGFEISSTAPAAINANGGTYIFLAVS